MEMELKNRFAVDRSPVLDMLFPFRGNDVSLREIWTHRVGSAMTGYDARLVEDTGVPVLHDFLRHSNRSLRALLPQRDGENAEGGSADRPFGVVQLCPLGSSWCAAPHGVSYPGPMSTIPVGNASALDEHGRRVDPSLLQRDFGSWLSSEPEAHLFDNNPEPPMPRFLSC